MIKISVDDIELGERHRALSEDAVERLAGSMSDIGLKQPISIRIADNVLIDGKPCDGVPILVAGRHRLAAAKSLGWTHIDCIEVADDPIGAELWEIAENLHRCDLTKDQRDQHIRRYAELLEARDRQVPQTAAAVLSDGRRKGPQHEKGVARQIAEATGLSDDTVRRALKPKVVPIAPPPLDPEDAYNRWATAGNNWWSKGSQEWRERWDADRDGTVFDRTAAAR